MAGHRITEQTYYEILEVQPGALQNEIHSAYQRAKATYSPDSPALYTMFTPEEARALLSLIEEAYETLSNQARRQAYDKKLISNSTRKESLELPDFDVDDMSTQKVAHARGQSTPPAKVTPIKPVPSTPLIATPTRESLPDGFKKTRYGIYEVNDEFETELRSCTQFDGAMLQRVRQYKKINLDQMAQETKISKTYLSAVESHSFDALPAAVFVRGFIVQMARSLGIDDKIAADTYMKIYKQHRLD